MQIPLESRLAADRSGLRMSHDGTLVETARSLVQPGAVAAPEVRLQEGNVGLREVADCENAKRGELLVCFRADAVDFTDGKRPDSGWNICHAQESEAIRLFEV